MLVDRNGTNGEASSPEIRCRVKPRKKTEPFGHGERPVSRTTGVPASLLVSRESRVMSQWSSWRERLPCSPGESIEKTLTAGHAAEAWPQAVAAQQAATWARDGTFSSPITNATAYVDACDCLTGTTRCYHTDCTRTGFAVAWHRCRRILDFPLDTVTSRIRQRGSDGMTRWVIARKVRRGFQVPGSCTCTLLVQF
jgi:hypothetical protein